MAVLTPYRLAKLLEVVGSTRPPNPIYVNTNTGSDGNIGSIDNPVATLFYAQMLCAGLPDWTIKVIAPTIPVRQQVDFETSMDLTIEGLDSTPWLLFGSEVITGSGWSGAGPVYSKALSNWTTVGTLVVTTIAETIGGRTFQLKLVPNTSTPTTPAAGEFGYVAGVLYIRLPGDASPSAHTFEGSKRNSGITTKGTGRLTVRDLDARHFINNALSNGLTGQPAGTGKLTVEDSTITYTGNAGVGAVGQWESTICTRVQAYRSSNDGFNWHATAGLSPVAVQNDCDGSYNGDKAGQSAQGTSNHEDTISVLNGGRYKYNVSGGMVVIDRARCDIHGDTVHGSVLMDRNMRLGNTAGTIASQAGCAWMDMSTGQVTGQVDVTNGQGFGVRVAPGASVSGASGISSTANAAGNFVS